MKNLTVAMAILIVGAGLLLESRYELNIHSPIVAKLDRLTGDVWIANSGVWRKVKHEEKSQCVETTRTGETGKSAR